MRIVIAGAHGQVARRLGRLLTARGNTAVGIIRKRNASPMTNTSSQTPCRTADSRVFAPAWMLAELRTMTPVIGSAPRQPQSMLPIPCAHNSRS